MVENNELIGQLPRMLSGEELLSALSVLPQYDDGIRMKSQTERIVALLDLYRIYIPSDMSVEIYNKLYLALLRSLQKKTTQATVQQRYENYKRIQNQSFRGIMGGSDSFTIIGISGIGKSSAIHRAISLLEGDRIIEIKSPYMKIIPCLTVQCPFDSSVKGLLLEILRKVDESLRTNYYVHAMKLRSTTTDSLIGSVSTIALNHIGLLIVDEIQNVVNSKNGKSLIGSLTQLINNSGISICMVGTPESLTFFGQAMQLARRSVGLQYTKLEYNEYFREFCTVLFQYQFVRNRTQITDSLIEWLYEHSAGVISIVVALVHDAQEIAMLNGREMLDLESLNESYKQRLSLLHDYINPTIVHKSQTSKSKSKKLLSVSMPAAGTTEQQNSVTVSEVVEMSRCEDRDIVSLLKAYFVVVEVST